MYSFDNFLTQMTEFKTNFYNASQASSVWPKSKIGDSSKNKSFSAIDQV